MIEVFCVLFEDSYETNLFHGDGVVGLGAIGCVWVWGGVGR